MNIRNCEYQEALQLYNKLIECGYPAEIFYDSRWRVRIQFITTDDVVNLDKL